MSPRAFNEATPVVDSIDQHIAAEMAEFRARLDYEFATKHLDKVSEEHPLFVDAASTWMHTVEREILQDNPTKSLQEARLEALDALAKELDEDGEDDALLDIVVTFQRVTRNEHRFGADEQSVAA